MRYPFVLTLLFLLHINLSAQDSLRLTFKMDGFKDKDLLSVYLIDGEYQIPTDKPEITISRKLDSPTRLAVYYKSRYKAFWLDNGEVEIYISKSNFAGRTKSSGSPSQTLWDSLVAAEPEDKARIIEDNIESVVVHGYLSSKSNLLLPADRERILAKVPNKVSDQANYDLSGLDIDNKTKVKENDMIFDFTAKDAEMNEFSTSDYRGEYLLLDFAATGCGPCWQAYPNMIDIVNKYPNLKVITYNQDFAKAGWQKQAERLNINIEWPVLWESENKKEVFSKYGIDGWPYFFLISPEGKVVEKWFGSNKGRLESALKRHLD
jgi:thiol-disulfide isomerase/thioredoxin